MALTPGTRLGPYEVTAAIGEGGMGQVFRARDTKLNREVALKVLPDLFASDPERLARFTREAQTLASLNHPNIAHIHGLEESGGVRALVMELVEGDDLSQRIARGAIPLDEALPIAKQIAEALEAAHEQGIIHRDLKPANIKVRPDGTVKVLDFGLAKAMEPTGAVSPSVSQAPTITTPALMTGVGMILGTAAYMSPEQARGKTVDKRADIWAFGAVLFEMLTGKRAFEGEDVGQTLARVVEREPDFGTLPPSVPPRISQVLRVCLRKDPKQRVGDIHDVRLALDGAFETIAPQTPAPLSAKSGRVGMAAFAVTVLAAAVAGVGAWVFKPAAPVQPRQVVRFTLTLAPDERLVVGSGNQLSSSVGISPDGSHIAYVGTRGGGAQQIFLRSLDGLEARPIPGTEGGGAPFFSPDGQWLGFISPAGLFKVSLGGGAVLNLGFAGPPVFGASWGANGTITAATQAGLQQIPDSGGTPQPLTHTRAGEGGQRSPDVLPGGRGVLFEAVIGPTEAKGVLYTPADGQYRDLTAAGTAPRYASTGHLIYAQAGTLFAVPFDLNGLTVSGNPAPVLPGVLQATNNTPYYSFSSTGTLVYVTGSAGVARNLVWVSRNGMTQPVAAPAREYDWPRLSPDGRRIAVEVTGQTWVYDTARDTLTRLTFTGSQNDVPMWSPDGTRVAMRSNREGQPSSIFWQMADGNGGQERLSTATQSNDTPSSFSPDGQIIAFFRTDPKTGRDIWVTSIKDHNRSLFLGTSATEGAPRFSPDGRWIAYVSNESGRPEIYVQPYPGPGGKWQISTDGGIEPLWNPNGRELFYRIGNKVMAVPVSTQPTFSPGQPAMLFEGEYLASTFPLTGVTYDVTRDGQRFLMVKDSQVSATQINVVVNWFEELKRLVPTK